MCALHRDVTRDQPGGFRPTYAAAPSDGRGKGHFSPVSHQSHQAQVAAEHTARRDDGCRGWCSIGNAVTMSSPQAAPAQRIVRLVGVYDADSSLRGELTYWVGARFGRRHCSLCEITHGSVRPRPEWKACQTGLPVPFDTFHRNDQPEPIRTAAGGRAPVVVAETDTGHVLLLASSDLDACDGSIDRLVEAINRTVTRVGLTWAAP